MRIHVILPTIVPVMAALSTGGLWQSRAAPVTPATVLTSRPGEQDSPALSPDGTRIAFRWAGERGDNIDIYVQRLDGGPPLRLTTDPAVDFAPAWSRDGKWIAFVRQSAPPNPGALYVVAPTGGAERKVSDLRVPPSSAGQSI